MTYRRRRDGDQPGWYLAPSETGDHGDALVRYHDGQGWTEHVALASDRPARPPVNTARRPTEPMAAVGATAVMPTL